MFMNIYYFFILFVTIVQCQNISITFPIYPDNTDIGYCTCDLTTNKCDAFCCCDPDCSQSDINGFLCASRGNQFTNTTPTVSSVQPTCFKNITIFYSNSPYVIQKMGELVCVDFQRDSAGQYYQQPRNQTLNPASFTQTINTQYSVTGSPTLSTNLTSYQIGSPLLTSQTTRSEPRYYSLPVKLFQNQYCTGSQAIAYMTDFTSTCTQLVNNDTCSGALNTLTYINSLLLLRSPSNLIDATSYCCSNQTVNASIINAGSCQNALRRLTITIYYQNPLGILNVSVVPVIENPTINTTFAQTFIVQFINIAQIQSSNPTTRNPGYSQSSNILAGVLNGSSIVTTVAPFSIVQSSSNGYCNTVLRHQIRFGENVLTTCRFNATNCASLYNLLFPTNLTNYYVGAYGNSDPLNITTDWLPVIVCTYTGTSSSSVQCSSYSSLVPVGSLCYSRLDIQIAYTKIGSIINPQYILSAVIFHYHQQMQTNSTLFVTESVTFQDISSAPVVMQGQIPSPNTRLPADFFSPFSGSQTMKSIMFEPFVYLLLNILISVVLL